MTEKIAEGTFVTAKTSDGRTRQGIYMGMSNGKAIVRGDLGSYVCDPDSLIVANKGKPSYLNK